MSERSFHAAAAAKRPRCRPSRRNARHSPSKRGRSRKSTPAERKAKFLKAFRWFGSIKRAAAEAGIKPRTHYSWLRNPRYAKRWAKAHRQAIDHEREMHEAYERMWDWDLDPVTGAKYLRKREKNPPKPFKSRIRARAPE
jgi:hypothetical protein